MAQLCTALSILVIVAVESTAGQVMMVSPMIAGMRRHQNQGNQMRVVRPMFQPATIISRPAYTIAEAPVQTEPKEPIDEQRLHERIKELEILKQDIGQKQMELEDKIAALDEQALSCHKQIDADQEVLRKLDALDRLHSAEQVRLERLIEQQRLAEYRDRMEQERMARQREALEEWNNAQKQRQKEENAEISSIEEPVTNCSNDKRHIDSETTSSKPITQQADEVNSEVQIQRPMSQFQMIHKLGHPSHSTSLQAHRLSKNPDITPGVSNHSKEVQVIKREGVMGLVSTTQQSTNGNVTSQQQFGRKTVDGYDVLGKKL